MTGQDIIDKFHIQVDDDSELSTDDELAMLNDVYGDICDDRDWEWLKETFTGTTSTSVPYIALPVDFKKVVPNKDNKSVVFVGTGFDEFKVVSFSDRRTYRDQSGYCYIDIPNQRLVFTLQPTTAQAIEFDYIKIQTDIALGTEPLFRSGFHPIIAYGMAARFPQIEQANKLTSYAAENMGLYLSQLHDLAYEDAMTKLAI